MDGWMDGRMEGWDVVTGRTSAIVGYRKWGELESSLWEGEERVTERERPWYSVYRILRSHCL